MPSFQKVVTDAFEEMTSLESPNDFFIASFVAGTDQLELHAKGRGGLAKVKEVLQESFQDEVAVAMFRVTAVDDRGKVKSFRTKLVHVIYIGPKTPVMKRAKISSWNSALKNPFTMNLSIQTDDVDGDLAEAALERSLRASGGAHQPTYFDFSNEEGSSGSLEKSMTLPSPKASPTPSSPSNAPRSPSGTRSYITTWNEHNKGFHLRHVDDMIRQYSEDYCKLVYTNAMSSETSVSEGLNDIGLMLSQVLDQINDEIEIVKVEKTQPDVGHTSEGIVFCYWTTSQKAICGFDTMCIVGGKIVVHTLVLTRGEGTFFEHNEDVASEATNEMEDASASHRADAGDLPSQEAASEQPEAVSQGVSEDDFVEVDQPPLSVGDDGDGHVISDQEEAAETADQTFETAEDVEIKETSDVVQPFDSAEHTAEVDVQSLSHDNEQ